MEEIIRQYGLLAVFAGTYIEGDVTVILAGVAAHLRLIDFRSALLVGFVAGVLRDLTCYVLGRSSRGARQSEMYARTAAAVERLAGRFGPLQIVFAPFVYGVRTASMIFWGIQGLPPARFLALDLAACALWATTFAGAGYLFSNRAESLVGEVKEIERWMLGALVIAVAAMLARRLLSRRC